ncbi:Uncharacterised protein [Escherichia coli]|uniref:Uncharacterized protein n=1 Tax=Escherichia coli TaxID=562 RepID=A0A377D1P7_ECOLX|nr:Uncharacterised protein [Escherichia coli]
MIRVRPPILTLISSLAKPPTHGTTPVYDLVEQAMNDFLCRGQVVSISRLNITGIRKRNG